MKKQSKKSGDKSRSKKRRNSIEPCWANIQQNLCIVGGTESTKGKGRRDGRKIGPNGNISWDEES